MSAIRIKLDFQNIKTDDDLVTAWFTFNRKIVKNMEQLQQLIAKKFNLGSIQFKLYMADCLLPNDQDIIVIRDNDLVVLKPEVKLKRRSKSKNQNVQKPMPKSVKFEQPTDKDNNVKVKTPRVSASTGGKKKKITSEKNKVENKKPHSNAKNKSNKSSPKQSHLQIPKSSSSTSFPSSDSSISLESSQIQKTERPKRKRKSQAEKDIENLKNEPITIFSPRIYLKRLDLSKIPHSFEQRIPHHKQKARKTFPRQTKSVLESILGKPMEECKPLVGLPNVGDYISFKIIGQLSKTSEIVGSENIKGLVTHVNCKLETADIFVINRTINEENKFVPQTIKVHLPSVCDKKIIEVPDDD